MSLTSEMLLMSGGRWTKMLTGKNASNSSLKIPYSRTCILAAYLVFPIAFESAESEGNAFDGSKLDFIITTPK